MQYSDNFLIFSNTDGFLSTSTVCSFTYKNITFNCVDQFIFYSKAMLFQDLISADRILKEEIPRKQKSLSLKIKNVDPLLWESKLFGILYVGCREKFTQHLHLLGHLLDTEDYLIVNASLEDDLGIGMQASDENVIDMSQWKGLNMLGNALMKVRKFLRTIQ